MKTIDEWMCAACLRLIAQGMVMVRPTNASPFILSPEQIGNALTVHGSKRFETMSMAKVPLYACTMVNNEYRCWNHV